MKKIFAVARWEFLEKVRTKAFIISLILTPAIIIGFAIVPTLLSGQESDSTKVIGIVDSPRRTDIYLNKMKQELEEFKLENAQPAYIIVNLSQKNLSLSRAKKIANESVISKKIEGYILISNSGTDSVDLEFRSQSGGNFNDMRRFEEAFNEIRINERLAAQGIDPEIRNIISNRVDIKPIRLKESGEETRADFLSIFFSSLIFLMLLFMMIIYSGQMLVRSLVEEKSNRLIEILISSCSSNELLAGKIFGLSSLGLFQLFIWILIGIGLAGASVIPLNAFDNIIPMLAYFILGFIFYTAIFVGVGSIVTTEQEAQQITSYLSLILILPIIFLVPAIENPDTMLLQVLTYIPFTLPATMLLRLNLSPLPIQVILITLFIMFVSIYAAIIIASKVFRIGILSYGKRPSIKELISWLKKD